MPNDQMKIEFTAAERSAVSWWLDAIDWEDIECVSDPDIHDWEHDGWHWDGGTLIITGIPGLECLKRTADFLSEAEEYRDDPAFLMAAEAAMAKVKAVLSNVD